MDKIKEPRRCVAASGSNSSIPHQANHKFALGHVCDLVQTEVKGGAMSPIICGVDVKGWLEASITCKNGLSLSGPIVDYTYPVDSPDNEPEICIRDAKGVGFVFLESEIASIERVS